jgi:DNA-binding protein YbaB
MFGKAKEQFELVKKAKELQKKLKETIVKGESGDVKVTMNGELKVQKVEITDGASNIEGDVKNAFNNAVDKAQKVGAELMKELGGLGFPGM